MQYIDLVHSIRRHLVEKKLISSTQLTMIPSIRTQQMANLDKNVKPKLSSVLILLLEKAEKIYFVVTQRQEYNGVHSGQISLPGGQIDTDDKDLQQTALRETMEEIGIPKSKIEILGKISELFIPPSNFHVTPFIGVLYDSPIYVKDDLEVAKIIEIPIDDLLDDNNIKLKYFSGTSGMRIEAPYFNVQGIEIWGATAMILAEFKAILKEIYSQY
jgi:8-oxo-dGTP pyrophosphatase MutT (NUDIX family)